MSEIKNIKKSKFFIMLFIYIGSILYAGSTFFVFVGKDIMMWKVFVYTIMVYTLILGSLLLIFYLLKPSIFKENATNYYSPLPINIKETGLDAVNFWPVYNLFFGIYIIIFPVIVSFFTKVFYGVFIINSIFGISVIISQFIVLKRNKNLGIIKEVFLLFFR